jgi:nucleoside triphosphatase
MYPGQWALPGGGIEEGERMEEALKREMREEVGLEVTDLEPFLFGDDTRMKLKDGTQEEIYMIYLLYQVKAVGEQVVIGEEFENYKWVGVDEAFKYDLNDPTVKTFEKLVK